LPSLAWFDLIQSYTKLALSPKLKLFQELPVIARCTVSHLHAVLFPIQFGDDLCFFAVKELPPNQISAVNTAKNKKQSQWTYAFSPSPIQKKQVQKSRWLEQFLESLSHKASCPNHSWPDTPLSNHCLPTRQFASSRSSPDNQTLVEQVCLYSP